MIKSLRFSSSLSLPLSPPPPPPRSARCKSAIENELLGVWRVESHREVTSSTLLLGFMVHFKGQAGKPMSIMSQIELK
ncbi:uncharacterized protein LOC111394369 isoform X3 [Olea europaea var. sylvestris]|uniref:uncharacterized protein LOC111394369 isoform X3 n=1 Tax=Olea europaea var. sylvestris TaxID=158386 RepID=UPI000C1CFE98|nr:uncharacterized protein LOC111394369 isoform X3 [Olea europaea var. sylvestris]